MEGEWVSRFNFPLYNWRRKEETTSCFPLTSAAKKVISPNLSLSQTETTPAESRSVSLRVSPSPTPFCGNFASWLKSPFEYAGNIRLKKKILLLFKIILLAPLRRSHTATSFKHSRLLTCKAEEKLAARRKALRALSCSGARAEHHGAKHLINMGLTGRRERARRSHSWNIALVCREPENIQRHLLCFFSPVHLILSEHKTVLNRKISFKIKLLIFRVSFERQTLKCPTSGSQALWRL